MLKLKHKRKLNLFSFGARRQPAGEMAFSPVSDDGDELTQAIRNDVVEQDDRWELKDADPDELSRFWSNVREEIAKDPEWSFVEED